MATQIPDHHPLRQLFREAAAWAFRHGDFEQPEARDRLVRHYLGENLLVRFVRTENLYRIRSARGRPLSEVAEMLLETVPRSAREEAALELQRHIGDYTLFISGLFPESLARLGRTPASPDNILMRVGHLFLSFEDPGHYYEEEGRRAYRQAAEISRELAPEATELFDRLSRFFRSYVNVLSLIRAYLEASSAFAEAKKIIL